MTDTTNKDGDGCFFEVKYNANSNTLIIEMHTESTPKVITYMCKYAHEINYINVALEECARMADDFDSAVKNLKEKE